MPETRQVEPLILYDGVCGLCNRWVQFVLGHDRAGKFRFAALQSHFAKDVSRDTADVGTLRTIYVVLRNQAGEQKLLSKSDAALCILDELGGLWRFAATILRMFPRTLRDCGYDLIARHRYRFFGRYDTCPLPDPKVRGRFLDLP
jgi:predicted DCC family thiol-disulfide oxidoreductase YuxK